MQGNTEKGSNLLIGCTITHALSRVVVTFRYAKRHSWQNTITIIALVLR